MLTSNPGANVRIFTAQPHRFGSKSFEDFEVPQMLCRSDHIFIFSKKGTPTSRPTSPGAQTKQRCGGRGDAVVGRPSPRPM